jgi:hypothetical protein
MPLLLGNLDGKIVAAVQVIPGHVLAQYRFEKQLPDPTDLESENS